MSFSLPEHAESHHGYQVSLPHGVQSTRPKTHSPQPDTTDWPQYWLAPIPARPSSLTSQRHTTDSPQYRLTPPFLPGAGSQSQLQQRCSVTL